MNRQIKTNSTSIFDNREYYRYALENFGDDKNTLTDFATKVGIDIEDIKDENENYMS